MSGLFLDQLGLGTEEWLLPREDVWETDGDEVRIREQLSRTSYVGRQSIRVVHRLFDSVKEYVMEGGYRLRAGEARFQQLPLLDCCQRMEYPFPAHHGGSAPLFQTNGADGSVPTSSFEESAHWNAWMNLERIGGGDQNHKKFLIDVLDHPEPFIAFLKETGSNAHRFSLEWEILEPVQGQYDLEAIVAYHRFITALKENGIEPYVTLHHFALPQWFRDLGGFEKAENVDLFIAHAMKMVEEFDAVNQWVSFNEPDIDGSQIYIRGKYPPSWHHAVHMQGVVIRNLLVTHCLLYKRIKALYPEKEIGITHQWLSLVPHEGNIFEKAACYFLSKIVHYAVYDFFRTGHFKFQFPFFSNTQLVIAQEAWESNNRFLDFIDVQTYGLPRVNTNYQK
jgi:beta-glucosidase/6-phospho-beta-glucosidase/beta-galactosidase